MRERQEESKAREGGAEGNRDQYTESEKRDRCDGEKQKNLGRQERNKETRQRELRCKRKGHRHRVVETKRERQNGRESKGRY